MPTIDLTDAELEAAAAVLNRAIEPHSCAPGTSWHPAYMAWAKCSLALGHLDPDDPAAREQRPECICPPDYTDPRCPNCTPKPRAHTVSPGIYALLVEVKRQDEKHGPFEGTTLGRSRLALACLEDEVEEAKLAWRGERKALSWEHTREEVLQVAAVAIRALRDAL